MVWMQAQWLTDSSQLTCFVTAELRKLPRVLLPALHARLYLLMTMTMMTITMMTTLRCV